MLFSVFMLALRSVQRNMLRSFLTILGIVIGVSAVITMVTMGNGATQAIQIQISGLGTNLLLIMPGQRSPGGGGASGGAGVPRFIAADATAIQSQIGGVKAVSPQGRASVTVVANGRNWVTSVTGSTNEWLKTATGKWLRAGCLHLTNNWVVPRFALLVRRYAARFLAVLLGPLVWVSCYGLNSSRVRSSVFWLPKAKAAWATKTTRWWCP